MLVVAGWIVFGGVFALAIAFIATCLQEAEWRAAFLSALISALLCGALTVLLVLDYHGKTWVLAGLLIAAVILVLVLVLPIGRGRSGLRIVSKRTRVDERDAVFHRFYRLETGTPEFDTYYRMHPEKKEFDNRVRAKPNLGEPGSRFYHPTNSAYMNALADVSALQRALADEPVERVEKEKLVASPDEFAGRLKGLAKHLGADLIGCTRLDQADLYSHNARGSGPWGKKIDSDHTHAVVIGLKMKWEMVRHAPGLPACTETMACYLRAGEIVASLARVIQRWGYSARPHMDGNYRVMCVPIAERAGLGETARNGLLIAPNYGSRLRLSVVTTDLPLAEDPSVNLGVQDFCSFCRKCATNCPSGAVDKGDKSVYAGVEKWQTDRDQCYRLWRNYGTDCGLCIKVCPYSKPASIMHQLVRWGIARNTLVRRLALWADDFLYGRRPKTRYNLPQWHADEYQTHWQYEEDKERDE